MDFVRRMVAGFAVAAFVSAMAPMVAIGEPAADRARPNFVLMLADNLGYGDLGCYGNRAIRTPRIDRLAAEGVRCTDFYAASPSCTPSRGALLTARHPERTGLTNQLSVEENLGVGLDHCERLLPQELQAIGYATACFGKWNIGFAPGSRPTERGFDEFFGHASGNMDYYTHVYNGRNDLFRGMESVTVPGYSTDLFADAACDFIRRQRDRPFFVYLPFNAPHFPNPRNKQPGEPVEWQAPDEYFEQYCDSPRTSDERKRYRAVVTALDAAVGRVVDTIDALGLRENTFIVFVSDNGAFMLPGRGLECQSNAPLRDGGVTLYEGGIRVACVARWPDHLSADSVCRQPLVTMDLLVTMLAAAGAAPPDDRPIDGRDMRSALAGRGNSPHDALYFRWRGTRAMRRGPFKLVWFEESDRSELYDLSSDLGEQTDLADERPGVIRQMRTDYERWLADVGQR